MDTILISHGQCPVDRLADKILQCQKESQVRLLKSSLLEGNHLAKRADLIFKLLVT